MDYGFSVRKRRGAGSFPKILAGLRIGSAMLYSGKYAVPTVYGGAALAVENIMLMKVNAVSTSIHEITSQTG